MGRGLGGWKLTSSLPFIFFLVPAAAGQQESKLFLFYHFVNFEIWNVNFSKLMFDLMYY